MTLMEESKMCKMLQYAVEQNGKHQSVHHQRYLKKKKKKVTTHSCIKGGGYLSTNLILLHFFKSKNHLQVYFHKVCFSHQHVPKGLP